MDHTVLAALLNDPVIQNGIQAAALVVVGFVMRAIRGEWLRHSSDHDREVLNWVAAQVVMTAEQTGATKLGTEKKAEALSLASVYLEKFGIKFPVEAVDAAIEAAVYTQLSQFNDPLPVDAGQTDPATGPTDPAPTA